MDDYNTQMAKATAPLKKYEVKDKDGYIDLVDDGSPEFTKAVVACMAVWLQNMMYPRMR